jgi:hypothetical protein
MSKPSISSGIKQSKSPTSKDSQTHRQSQDVSELTNLLETERIVLSHERQESLRIDKTRPREKKPLWLTRGVAIYDTSLVLVSSSFILLGVFSKYLDGKPVASHEAVGNFILLATKWVRNANSITNFCRGLLFGISSFQLSLRTQLALLRHG